MNGITRIAFGIDFDLGSDRVAVERTGKEASELTVVEADATLWPISPTENRKTGARTISNAKWKTVLGDLFFGFNQDTIRKSVGKYGPTFRSLFAYFARRESVGGFIGFATQSKEQSLYDIQVAISFLLGLDWTIPQQLQSIRDREASLKELRAAAKTGALGGVISSTAELRTDLTVAEDRVNQLRRSLSNFRVLPEYHDLETEASTATRELGELSDDNTVDRHLLAEIEAALTAEAPPPLDNLVQLYEQAGVVLPGSIRVRFERVRQFHESVIRNRRSYLEGEIAAARQRMRDRDRRMATLDQRRAEIMSTLRSHGALEHFSALQGELARLEAQTETIRHRFEAAENLEGLKSELEIDRQRLFRRLQQDFREQAEVLKRAILAFESISKSLYEDAGKLTISETANGPEFEVLIHGKRSKGVSNMQIFCFDMMLMQLAMERGIGPRFLIHDSHLFDGVDERQTAHALKVGADLAKRCGFQYIVTMNSNDVPSVFPDGFVLEPYILPTQLTDVTDQGGLFGFRFA